MRTVVSFIGLTPHGVGEAPRRKRCAPCARAGAISVLASMASLPSSITVEVRCIRLPAACAGEAVYLGIQRDRDVVNIVPAAVGKTVFTPDFRLTDLRGVPNFLGPYAQGPRDERFFYLSWGRGSSAPTFQMFRRLKVHLSHLAWKHIKAAARRGEPLRVMIDMTDRCGQPLCASAWADDPAVSWTLS